MKNRGMERTERIGRIGRKKKYLVSFRRELLLCFVLVALVPLLISGFFLLRAMHRKIAQDFQREAAGQIQEAGGYLEDFYGKIKGAARAISENEIVHSALSGRAGEAEVYPVLFSESRALRDGCVFRILDARGVCLYSTVSGAVSLNLPVYFGILREAAEDPGAFILRRSSEADEAALRAALSIFDGEDLLGFVLVDISGEGLLELLAKADLSGNFSALLDPFWEIAVCESAVKETGLLEEIRMRYFEGKPLHARDDPMEFSLSRFGDHGFTLVILRNPIFTSSVDQSMLRVILAMAGISLLLCMLFAGIISAALTAPVRQLTEAMASVENGNLSAFVESSRKDEFGDLSRSFNRMTAQLQDLVLRERKKQKDLADSRTAMMQAQLNPHFLYNTLDTIKWMGAEGNVPGLPALASGLAKILRTSISDRMFVPLSEEISLVETYMEIQKVRFGNACCLDLEVPPELEDCLVPKLILQPIVENALIHGLREKEAGQIFLYVYREEDTLVLEVSDDGAGMPEEILRKINSPDRESLRGHLGLYNVRTILELNYGPDYGISAKREKEGGSTVKLTLPARREM